MNLLKQIKQNWKNLIFILLPIIVCILVYFTPKSFQEMFVLNLNNLNSWSWFTYIFLHQTLTHIFMNLLIFTLAIISAYYLTPKEDRKTFVWIFYLSIVLIPLITLVLLIYLRNIGLFPINLINSRGFSGISAGALGILGYTISKDIYLSSKSKKSVSRLLNAVYYISLPCLAVMVINLNYILSIIIVVIWLLMVASWIAPNLIHARKKKIKLKGKPLDVKHLIIPMTILLIGCLLMIPKNLVANGSAVNTPAHLFGFVIGYGLSFVVNLIFTKRPQ